MPNPRKPRPARVRIASEAFSVNTSGNDRVELRITCVNMIRQRLAPTTRADSTKASALTRTTSLRTTRKYCGMNTTVIDSAADQMPPHRLDWPPEMTIDMTIASSSDGNA